MLDKGMRKPDIEQVLEGKGDFVKINYLTEYIKKMPPIDMRKFAYLKLAEIYLEKDMFLDAAIAFKNAAINSITFREKRENYFREAQSYIFAGKLDEAGKAANKALAEANTTEKKEIYEKLLEAYRAQAQKFLTQNKREHASKIYEKLYKMKISDQERQGIKEILLDLYEKLGKRKEYHFLKEMDE